VSKTLDLRELIAKKRDGGELTPDEIGTFVTAAATGAAPEPQLASMLMAIFIRGLGTAERTAYALSMMRSGEVLNWDHLDRPTVDKHSTGGVGDKVSLPWAPLMVAVGYAVPMISGRGLGHTGGTLDKLEAIPGYRTDLSSAEMDAVMRSVGCTITGQTGVLVPADKTLYDLRSRTATVATLDHIAPSIMSKKLAEGADTLVLDVKVGSGAFMKTVDDARDLGRVMVDIGRGAGRHMAALLTWMDSPLGLTSGNAVEVTESVQTLKGGGPADLRKLTLDLAEAAVLASGEPMQDARARLERALDDGSAMTVFERMVEAHGGDVASLHDPSLLRGAQGLTCAVLEAPMAGVITGIDALGVGLAVDDLGGVQTSEGRAPDPGVAANLELHLGDTVEAGQPWARLLHRDGAGLESAVGRMKAALVIEPEGGGKPRLIESL
jgi:pyrimidine-nucleoside phosphorylase